MTQSSILMSIKCYLFCDIHLRRYLLLMSTNKAFFTRSCTCCAPKYVKINMILRLNALRDLNNEALFNNPLWQLRFFDKIKYSHTFFCIIVEVRRCFIFKPYAYINYIQLRSIKSIYMSFTCCSLRESTLFRNIIEIMG